MTPQDAKLLAEAYAKREKSASAIEASLASELALLNEESQVYQTIGQQVAVNNDILKIESQMIQSQISSLKEQLEHKIRMGDIDEASLKSIGEQIAAEKKVLEATVDRVKASETLQSTTSGLVTMLTGIDDSWKQTFVGSFSESITTATSLHQVIGDLGAGLTRSASLANVLGSSISKVSEATFAMAMMQDEATAAFSKAVGTGTKYHSMITSISQSNRQYGISAEDSALATRLLFTNLNLFSGMSAKASSEMVTLVARLDAVGISADTTVTNMELAMRVLGMSANEAKGLQLELLATAEALKLPPQIIAEGFASAAPILAAHGRKMIDVFKDMAIQSKATGLAMDDLIGFASQFNTYEGAAQITADFNHILGGAFLNSLELLTATESERIKIVQQAMTASGKQFEQMDAHTKRALTHQLGLKSVAEAARLLNPEMIGLTEAQKKTRIGTEALAKRASIAQSVLTELKNAALSLAVGVQPLVKVLSKGVTWLTALNDKTTVSIAGFKMSLIPALILAAGAFKTMFVLVRLGMATKVAYTAVTVALTGATTAEAAAKTSAAGATGILTSAQTASNVVMKTSVKTLVAFAAAVALVGVGIGAAAAGVGYLAQGFSQLNAEQMNGVLIVMGGMAAVILAMGLLMLSPIGQGAAIGILALGAAIFVMGSGVAVAALGISVLVASMKGLNPTTIMAAGAAFGAMSAALLPLMPWVIAGPLVAGVLIAIGLAALTIGTGFALASSSLVTFDSMLSKISDSSVLNLMSIADQVERIVGSINGMSVLKASLFSNIVEKIAPQSANMPASTTAASVSTAAMQRSESGSRTSVQTTPKNTRDQAQVKPINIVLKLNEREISKIAWKEIKKELERVGGRKIQGPRIG